MHPQQRNEKILTAYAKEDTPMFQTIIFAYDGSAECRDAFEEGIVLASRFQARCFLLAVIPPLPATYAEGPVSDELLAGDRAAVQAILDEGVSRMRQAGIEATGHLQTDEEPAKAIGAFAANVSADLIIVGHHRRTAIQRWWHGSVGHALLDHVPCSVFVSMPKGSSPR
jgi:nucleotide-binding universal stress UspA family protein